MIHLSLFAKLHGSTSNMTAIFKCKDIYKLETIWKKENVAYLRHYSSMFKGTYKRHEKFITKQMPTPQPERHVCPEHL